MNTEMSKSERKQNETISEETANDLIKAFDEHIEVAKSFSKTFKTVKKLLEDFFFRYQKN